MAPLIVFLYIGGEWDDSNRFINYSVRGVIVPLNCLYDWLIGIIAKQFGKDANKEIFGMHYQVFEQGQLIPIFNDDSLEVYIKLKKGEKDQRNYPICVEELVLPHTVNNLEHDNIPMENSIASTVMPMGYINGETSIVYRLANNAEDDLNLRVISTTPTLEEMGMELSDHVLYPIAKVENALSNVKKGSIFKNKELIVISLSLLAMKKRFQYTVVKSDIKFYWLKCFEHGCTWQFRSSRTGSLGNFKIRQINDVHTCNMDSVLAEHRQATSYVIADCLKHNFISLTRGSQQSHACQENFQDKFV